jgi:hypothetical protein
MSTETKTEGIDYSKLEFHPFANVFPPMPDKELKAFKADIKANGIRVPITLYEGKILDGKNRYTAAKDAHRYLSSDSFAELPAGTDPIKFVISTNVARRHLSETQRAMAAAKLADLQVGANQHNGKGVSIETASDLMNASKGTTKRCKAVLAKGVPALVKLIEEDKIAASVGETIAGLDKSKQDEIVNQSSAAKRKAKLEELTKPPVKTPASTQASDNIDNLETAYIDGLKALKEHNAKNADAAVASLVKSLQLLDFLKDYKLKKAA